MPDKKLNQKEVNLAASGITKAGLCIQDFVTLADNQEYSSDKMFLRRCNAMLNGTSQYRKYVLNSTGWAYDSKGVLLHTGVRISKDVMIHLINRADEPAKDRFYLITHRFSMSDIEPELKKMGLPRWRNLSLEQKEDILWSLGMDIKEKEVVNPWEGEDPVITRSRWHTERLPHRNLKGEVVHCVCVVGSERVDKEWLLSGYASYEAKLYSQDRTLRKELAMIERGK